MALGASKWQTVNRVVLSATLPGMLTGLIIGLARIAGEIAPIMWTAVTFSATPVYKYYGIIPDVTQPMNNLVYHLLNLIYFLGAWDVETNAWGTALCANGSGSGHEYAGRSGSKSLSQEDLLAMLSKDFVAAFRSRGLIAARDLAKTPYLSYRLQCHYTRSLTT